MDFEDQEENTSLSTPSEDVTTQQPNKPRYRECLKNHAVNIGGHAVDGCGEFIPSGPEGTLEALKCAACNCHRNFHRKEDVITIDQLYHQMHPHFPQSVRAQGEYNLHVGMTQQRPLALPSTSRDDQEEVKNRSVRKKRFRTKFTQEQKEKMIELAERLGWRIQKQDEEVVKQFCEETGLKRHVFKVWMHNNKHILANKS